MGPLNFPRTEDMKLNILSNFMKVDMNLPPVKFSSTMCLLLSY